jgi:glycosyltransferase involved in cell wall biosynthesis
MDDKPLVSVIIPLYNPLLEFMREAIESVINQTYSNWEIMLIDDGSDQEIVDLAMEFVYKYPEKIHLLQHENRQNKGGSVSRQLGVDSSKGELVAFLDADDLWLPEKLERQVDLLEREPEAGMLYGNTVYWYSWDGSSTRPDYVPNVGFKESGLVHPPRLLPLQLTGKAAVPCPTSVIIRREVLDATGGWEISYKGVYDDQIFYAKIYLIVPVYVSTTCWDKYRQHPASLTRKVEKLNQTQATRIVFLKWLENYLIRTGISEPEVWQALKRELWYAGNLDTQSVSGIRQMILRRFKKWLLRLEDFLLPKSFRRWIWLGKWK